MNTEKKSLWRKKSYSKENSIAYRKKLKKKNSKLNKERKLSETDSSDKKKNKTYSHRAGDWVCILCNNHNYSFRDICNRCKKQTKSENLQQQLYLIQHQNENFNPNIYSQLINFNYPFYNGMNNNQNFKPQSFDFNGQNFGDSNVGFNSQNFKGGNFREGFNSQNFKGENFGDSNVGFDSQNFKGENFREGNMGFNENGFGSGNLNFENENFEDEDLKKEKVGFNSFNNIFVDKSDFSEGYEKEERTPFRDISNNTSNTSEDKFLKLQNKVFFELEEKFEEYSTNDEDDFNEKENKILQFLNI